MAAQPHPSFLTIQPAVSEIFGTLPNLTVLHEMEIPFAHEAGVYLPDEEALFVTSNRFMDPQKNEETIIITRVLVPADGSAVKVETVNTENVPMANGGIRYTSNGYDGILFCAQGNMQVNGGISYMSTKVPYESQLLVNSFNGRPFNSPNDVVTHADGSIWFTDPIYGFEQGIRPKPRLPNQVYRYDPSNKSTRAVADGFGRPNGLAFSPDMKTLYVSDSDWIHGDGTTDDTRVSHIYAFDVAKHSGGYFLENRRLFAMADNGIPDGVKCDVFGNVYSGCGDGINIWSPQGILIGKILVEGGAANFCFGFNGQMFILAEKKLYSARLSPSVRGAFLDL
ncbi:hypothetical protein CDD82_7208 [Ophiocordyceps australis]|uniref:SMP-30/Gluconolactonase/LRE-like region domain-containing protein n=1 Tax=Ophiocordyceps australis TaxID=1399860 RepID=A0A2C5XWR4_9HYPO|nr:hypothetical protein CDD82_7208 [Ophiocordyceps australis]